jgi:hypothetical protein
MEGEIGGERKVGAKNSNDECGNKNMKRSKEENKICHHRRQGNYCIP